MSEQMFENASRAKLRFDTGRGLLTVEDLWDLPLTSAVNRPNLNAIAVGLYRQTKEAADIVSFVDATETNAAAAEIQLKFDIVKHIIDVRVRERDERKAEADRREKKTRLLELIAKKQDEQLAGLTIEELRAQVEAL